jgi:hypothetical protein
LSGDSRSDDAENQIVCVGYEFLMSGGVARACSARGVTAAAAAAPIVSTS